MGLMPIRRRPDRASVLTAVCAILIAGPLVGLPLSYLVAPGELSKYSNFLPDAFVATGLLIVGVGSGTLAARHIARGAGVVLRLPRPLVDRVGAGAPARRAGLRVHALRARASTCRSVRSTGGAIVIFTLVLYPYVYLLARSAFLAQSRTLLEAARGLGLGRGAAILRVGLPLARPAILGGVALALMETLADFGTVNLLGVRTFTDAIYRVWFNAFNREAAMQFATILMSVTLMLLLLERLARGRARYHYTASRGEVVPPVRLHGPAAAAAVIVPLALVGLVVAWPLAQLGVWSVQSVQQGLLAPEFAAETRTSILLSAMSAVIVPAVALALAYGVRTSRSRLAGGSARLATIGYGLPGSVVAVAVIVPLAWLDHRLDGAAASLFGLDVGLIFTGTVIGLFCAYLVRFLALAWGAIESSLIRIPRELDDAARGLGGDRLDVIARVHVPLMRTGLLTAALLVFTEVMKELPATLLLRPLGGDTLAVAVWQATTESLFKTAALPALLIVVVGLVPVALMIKLSGRRGAELEAGQSVGSWAEVEREAVPA